MEVVVKSRNEHIIKQGDGEITLTLKDMQDLFDAIVDTLDLVHFYVHVDKTTQITAEPDGNGYDEICLKSSDGRRLLTAIMTVAAENELIRLLQRDQGIIS
jgi:hypothetical protein